MRGGKDYKKHVRDVLSMLLSNEFARLLSWSGQKGTISVKNMKFVDVLIGMSISCAKS